MPGNPTRAAEPEATTAHGRLLALALVGLATARIVATYPVFNQTFDEPAHLAAGMEWLDRGRYAYEALHPPLARVAVAIGPRLSGVRSTGEANMWREGNALLYAHGSYERNLAMARLGILPFFVVAAWLTWAWARALYGDAAALVALGLFTTLPPILGHAGVATTDMALVATLVAALYAFDAWLVRPSVARGAWLGLASGLAVLTKLSALVFLPVSALLVIAARWRRSGDGTARSRLGSAAACLAAASLVVWAGYRFEVGRVSVLTDGERREAGRQADGLGLVASARRAVDGRTLPAPRLVEGIELLRRKQAGGNASYLLGERLRNQSVWYFFPVAVAVKSPLPFLILAGVGLACLAAALRRDADGGRLVPAAAACGILLASLPSHVNIGVRHVLPLLALLAMVAGHGVIRLWASGAARTARPAVALLLGWHVLSTSLAHPHYLAYFNELAAGTPDRILVDSDLDWGQDLKQLASALRERGVTRLSLAYFGSADPARHGLPPVRKLEPYRPTTGWVAISVTKLRGRAGYGWLDAHRPVAIVGTSIWLYYIPEADLPGRAGGRGGRRGPAARRSAAGSRIERPAGPIRAAACACGPRPPASASGR
ncbi:MAG TPA: glycosyltransferase family 39 protein [Thermodesulfobacteriota bacterium]